MNPREVTELSINLYHAMQKHAELEGLLTDLFTRTCKTVLEIGSGHGGTGWAWSQLPGNVTMISIDLPGGEFGGGLSDDDKRVIDNWVVPTKNTYFSPRDSHDVLTLGEVKEVIGETPVDFLFIDGDHTYEGAKKDFEMYSQLVAPGGVIALHDICDHSTSFPTCQVRRFWNEIKDKYIWKEIITEPTTWGGIGVLIQKDVEKPFECVDNCK